MSLEDRVTKLEADLERFSLEARKALAIQANFNGQSEAVRNILQALVLTHPAPELLATEFENHLLNLEGHALNGSNSEDYVTGVQNACALLRLALKAAHERANTQNTPPA